MKQDEAKFILGACRPGGRDAGDPTIGEALQEAKQDPALGAWFAREQARDEAIAAKLREIAPPAGLREAILAGARASAPRAEATATRAFWRQPAWLAAAAAVAGLLAVSALVWPRAANAAEAPLVKFALADTLKSDTHDGHDDGEQGLRALLGRATTRLGGPLPVDFVALARKGCREVNVDDRMVLEVCFERGGKWYHCYIARCGDFPALAAREGAKFADNGTVRAVTWADGTHRFVVAGFTAREELARLL